MDDGELLIIFRREAGIGRRRWSRRESGGGGFPACTAVARAANAPSGQCRDGAVVAYLTSEALQEVLGASGRGRIVPCITGPLTRPV